MKDQISALQDGELSPAEASKALAALRTDAELRRAWDEYHRVGDALRGHLSQDISQEVAVKLAAEPVVLAPRRMVPQRQTVGRWASAAAVLAAVGAVSWVAFAPQQEQISVASAPQSVAVPTSSSAVPALMPAPRASASSAPPTASMAGVENYLLAHQRYSPTNAMHGFAPYVRTVSSGDER